MRVVLLRGFFGQRRKLGADSGQAQCLAVLGASFEIRPPFRKLSPAKGRSHDEPYYVTGLPADNYSYGY